MKMRSGEQSISGIIRQSKDDDVTTRERINQGRAFVLEHDGEIVGTVLFSVKN